MPKADLLDGSHCSKNSSCKLKEKKGVENVVVDHLSRLTIAHNTHSPPINDEFLKESMLLVENAPWYAHIVNFLTTEEILTY